MLNDWLKEEKGQGKEFWFLITCEYQVLCINYLLAWEKVLNSDPRFLHIVKWHKIFTTFKEYEVSIVKCFENNEWNQNLATLKECY